ncbi:uncharacterized protein LODBEIA_P01270 [Lodderomyces beijingensis]|uniref:Uncharacterized protein n=1 Tax=Lodderomyces beijingensis TaxID=1775926 RepID=A0ABP0ZCJ7_9ASCO
MKDDISYIIDHLDSSSEKDILQGLDLLDQFLFNLVPEIQLHVDNFTHSDQLRAFIKLQDNAALNVVSYLAKIYNRELANDQLVKLNRTVQGCLLIHPASRAIFNRAKNMTRLLNVLHESNDIAVSITLVSTLIHIVLDEYENFRTFERCGGCGVLIRHLKLNSIDEFPQSKPPNHSSPISSSSPSSSTTAISNQQNLNFKIIEFLMLYMTEEPDNTHGLTVKEKSKLFEKDCPEIDLLVESLIELNKL